MTVTDSKQEIIELTSRVREDNSLGYVPTMGALHQGHISLMNLALAENDAVVVTIFVNPTQFNNLEDLKKYPDTREADISLITAHTDYDRIILYFASRDEVYPEGFVLKEYDFGELGNVMEGSERPGHFQGVGNVLDIFFHLIRPDKAYFGEKDFQQLLIVKRLVEIVGLPIEITGCPIARENNGLAMSSRNMRLSPAEKQKAATLYQILQSIKESFPTLSIADLEKSAVERLQDHSDITLEYLVIADEKTLQAHDTKKDDSRYRAFIVAHIGGSAAD